MFPEISSNTCSYAHRPYGIGLLLTTTIFRNAYQDILFAMLPQPFLSICAQKLFQCLQTQNYLFIKVNDCVLLSYRVRVSEWIYTLQLPECQETPRSKQFKWQQQDSIPPGCESESRCCHINVNLSYVYYLS